MPKMNTSKIPLWGAWWLVSLSVVGCAQTPYADTPQSGQSVRQALKAQTLNPDAGQKSLPPSGADGAVMKSAIDRYQSSFDKPPAPVNVMSIGVGGSVGSGGH